MAEKDGNGTKFYFFSGYIAHKTAQLALIYGLFIFHHSSIIFKMVTELLFMITTLSLTD